MNDIEKQDTVEEFRARLKALIVEFDVSVENTGGYYGEPDGFEVFCGQKSAANIYKGMWNFGNGLQSTKQLGAELLNAANSESDRSDFIVSAAMLMDDGTVVTGVRHFSPDMRATLHRIYGDGYHRRVKEQGFIDNRGQFLNRETAWARAKITDQIRQNVSAPGTLYSENLY